jgi:O-antigen/teichoic acid export membrane protein
LQPLIAVIIPLRLCDLGMTKTMALSELGIIMGMTMPLLSIPSTIIGALCMILIPRINNSDNQNINKQLKNYLNFTITCIFLFIPLFVPLGSGICTFVFGNISAGTYLSISSWIMIPMGIAQITTSVLNAMNQEQKTFIYYIISSVILILLCTILPNYFGVRAMLIANGISTTILSVLNIIKIKKITNFKSSIIKTLFIHFLLCLPVILLTTLCYNALISYTNTFLSLAITSIISIITYIALLIVFGGFKIEIIKDYLSKFNNKKNI